MTRSKRFTENFTNRKSSKFLVLGLLFVGTVLLILATSFVNWGDLFQPIQDFIFQQEDHYQKWVSKQSTNNPLFLILLAFVGGLIASISPCKLALLTVNLSYIGTREIKSRWDAFIKAGSFVLG